MFSYILYIIPLGDSASYIHNKLDEVIGNKSCISLLHESEEGYVFQIKSEKVLDIQWLTAKSIGEIPSFQGSHWKVYCGHSKVEEIEEILYLEDYLAETEEITIDPTMELPLDVTEEYTEEYTEVTRLATIGSSLSEGVWRFL
jgi:hypothetical protein